MRISDWSSDVCSSDLKRQTFDEAADALRVALKHAIGSWSTCFDQILVGISGGLDSSIVAAALGPRTPHLRCLTMVEPGTDGDERRSVGALIQKLGVHLDAPRSDERRVGKACVSTCRSRWSPYHSNKTYNQERRSGHELSNKTTNELVINT